MKILLILEKTSLNFTRSALFLMKIKVSLKYFINGYLWKHFLASNTPQTTSNLIFLTNLASLGVSQSFDLNFEQLSCEKCQSLHYLVTRFANFSLRPKFVNKRL